MHFVDHTATWLKINWDFSVVVTSFVCDSGFSSCIHSERKIVIAKRFFSLTIDANRKPLVNPMKYSVDELCYVYVNIVWNSIHSLTAIFDFIISISNRSVGHCTRCTVHIVTVTLKTWTNWMQQTTHDSSLYVFALLLCLCRQFDRMSRYLHLLFIFVWIFCKFLNSELFDLSTSWCWNCEV